jgi:hypothetical protein
MNTSLGSNRHSSFRAWQRHWFRSAAALLVASTMAVVAVQHCVNRQSTRCLGYNVGDCWQGWSSPVRYWKLLSVSYAYKPDQLVSSMSGWHSAAELQWDPNYSVTTSGTVGVYLSANCSWGYIGDAPFSTTCYGAYVPLEFPQCAVW